MRAFWVILLFSITTILKGQYPFDKYPDIKSKTYFEWKLFDRVEKKQKVDYKLTIPNFYNNQDSLTIQLTNYMYGVQKPTMRVFHNKKQIQKNIINLLYPLGSLESPDTAYVADYNNDGLLDVKFYHPNILGCGAFNSYAQVFYLLQKKDGTFTQISFTDYFKDFKYRSERDFDGDGNYEIITQTFQNHGKHNYWVFNLYDFTTEGLINVNSKNNYPIMIRLNYSLSDNISKEVIKRFVRKLPDDYCKKH